MPPSAGVLTTISGAVVSIGAISCAVAAVRRADVDRVDAVAGDRAGVVPVIGPPSTLTWYVTPRGTVTLQARRRRVPAVASSFRSGSPVMSPVGAWRDRAGEVEALVRADGDVARRVDRLHEVLELACR